MTNTVQNWLREKMSEKFIDKHKWPLRSPDLNLCDFFLWGYLKQRVYYPRPNTLDDFKANITNEIKIIKTNMIKELFII